MPLEMRCKIDNKLRGLHHSTALMLGPHSFGLPRNAHGGVMTRTEDGPTLVP